MRFPKPIADEDVICNAEGFEIFGMLRKKYSNYTDRDLDIVLNSLCCALIRLAKLSVPPSDYDNFVVLVTQILRQNLGGDDK